MSEKQTIEAGNSLPPPLCSACECQNWADLDLRVRLLTGHHARCPHGGNPLDAAFALLRELTRGIEYLAHEEDDEVFMDCWKPYRKAKALEGVYLPEAPEQAEQNTSREARYPVGCADWLCGNRRCEMKLWLLKPVDGLGINNPWDPWYDKAFGFVVRAETEDAARKIANDNGGSETGPVRTRVYRTGGDPWLDKTLSTCSELLPDGEAGLVLKDFASA